jgi:hypothetical protein
MRANSSLTVGFTQSVTLTARSCGPAECGTRGFLLAGGTLDFARCSVPTAAGCAELPP